MPDTVKITLRRDDFELSQAVNDPVTPETLEDALDELRYKMTLITKPQAQRDASELHHRRD